MARTPIRCRFGFHKWEIADMAFDARSEPWEVIALHMLCPRCGEMETRPQPREGQP